MECCFCAYIKKNGEEAFTVINGYAVCYDHMGVVAVGVEWSKNLTVAKQFSEAKD